MNHTDHLNLIRDGVPGPGGVWADLGSGHGAFTLALAELLAPTGVIYAVDKNRASLRQLTESVRGRFPSLAVHSFAGDFRRPLDLPLLDGVIMANSLHFVRQKETVLQHIRGYLRPTGRLIIVEYNIDRRNMWVPHPFSYPTWEKMAAAAGFKSTRRLAIRPSRSMGEIYAALSLF